MNILAGNASHRNKTIQIVAKKPSKAAIQIPQQQLDRQKLAPHYKWIIEKPNYKETERLSYHHSGHISADIVGYDNGKYKALVGVGRRGFILSDTSRSLAISWAEARLTEILAARSREYSQSTGHSHISARWLQTQHMQAEVEREYYYDDYKNDNDNDD